MMRNNTVLHHYITDHIYFKILSYDCDYEGVLEVLLPSIIILNGDITGNVSDSVKQI